MSTPSSDALLERDAATLSLTGRCDTVGVASLDLAPVDVEGVDTLDIAGVRQLDSTGVALISELVARIDARTGRRPAVTGRPDGLEDLCRAYRIEPDFSDFP